MSEDKKKQALRIGALVFLVLMVLTLVEFLLSAYVSGLWSFLLVIALVKAVFVVQEYMHLPSLFGGDAEAHS